MAETSDLIVMWAVILARLLVPLTIPRYPLPGVVASSLLDMVDYTIIRDRTNLPMEGYQGFDKALDLYYLTIAYIDGERPPSSCRASPDWGRRSSSLPVPLTSEDGFFSAGSSPGKCCATGWWCLSFWVASSFCGENVFE